MLNDLYSGVVEYFNSLCLLVQFSLVNLLFVIHLIIHMLFVCLFDSFCLFVC